MNWLVLLIPLVLLMFGAAFVSKKRDRVYTTEPYDGLIGSPGWNRCYPRAFVQYPPCEYYPYGTRSIEMPIGNAQSYAKIFNGRVVVTQS